MSKNPYDAKGGKSRCVAELVCCNFQSKSLPQLLKYMSHLIPLCMSPKL